MARLWRPAIPLSVKCEVAARQVMRGSSPTVSFLTIPEKPLYIRLQILLTKLAMQTGCKVDELELHHRPALVNRQWNARKGDYDPPANSAEHLIYLTAADHDVETRVRGIGAQRSDLSQCRYLKRVERNREPKPKKPMAGKRVTHKLKWPKRKFASRSKL